MYINLSHSSSPRFMSKPPKNFGELDSPPPSNVPTLKKKKTHFFTKTKYCVSNNEIRIHFNVEI